MEETTKLFKLAVKEYIIQILLECEENRLQGKGFDFYFVLNNNLAEIIKELEVLGE